jgi:DNA polymerase-4
MAVKACPGLIVIPPSHDRYAEVSTMVFAIFRSYTPMVEGLSLDEAFLDVAGLKLHFDSPLRVGESIRSRIRADLGLPSSVGVAMNKLLAKLASEQAKPDGIKHISVSESLSFLHALPAAALPGVGPATLAALRRLGVTTVGDIADLPEATLTRSLGPASGRNLAHLAMGVDERKVEPDLETKSVSVEETYPVDLSGSEVIHAAMLGHAHRLSERLRRSGLMGRTVTIKVRFHDFETITRSHTGGELVDGWRELATIATGLLQQVDTRRAVRLLGLGVSAVEPADQPRQMSLDAPHDWGDLEGAVAKVRERYGEYSIGSVDRVPLPGPIPGGSDGEEAGRT